MNAEEDDPNRISFENNISQRDDELSSYKDDLIEVDLNGLKIKKYYIPTFSTKEIPIYKIKDINLIELSRISGKYTFFGFCWKLYYYHFDKKRPQKTHGITLKEEGNSITIGITPDDPKKCFNVLRYLMTHMKNNKKFSPIFDDTEVESLKKGKGKGKEKMD